MRCCSLLLLLWRVSVVLLCVCPVHVWCEEEYVFPDPVEWEKTLNEEVINIDFTTPPPTPTPTPKPNKVKKPKDPNAPTPTNKGRAPPSPFKSTARESEFIRAFGEWQNNTIMHKSCRRAQMIFFKPVAGFGDSVNAFYTAIRQAFSLGRLFLMDWSVSIDTPRGDAIDVALWKIGIQAPFVWDINEVRTIAPWCHVPLTRDIKISNNMNDRIIPIYGQLAMGHILSQTNEDNSPLKISVVGKDGKSKKIVQRVNNMDMAGITEEWMATHLLVPNESIQSRLTPILESWRSSRGVIAMHIRTGAADGDGKSVPDYARFLAPKDESRFTRYTSKLILDKYDDDRQDIHIFVATDNPTIVPNMAKQLAPAQVVCVNAQATGLEIIQPHDESSSQGTTTPHVVHSASSRTISIAQAAVSSDDREYKPQPLAIIALERMFMEWFLLRQANHVILTAWSLFGSTATNTHPSVRMINSSKCGKAGWKACYPGAISH